MLRIVFFGSAGRFSAAHLDALAHGHRVLAAISAAERSGARAFIGRTLRAARLTPDPIGAVARSHGIPRWFADRDAATDVVSSLKPDVVCIAGYPWLLPPPVWQVPPLGALNCHPSLLPRHRGILPLFWIYYHGDERTGVTIHRVGTQADAGEIVCQEAYPLRRGLSVDRTNESNIRVGSRLLRDALAMLASGRPCGIPQDEAAATSAPRVKPGTPMVDFTWDVGRVWHFLAGLYPRFVEPLRDGDGNPVRYGSVLGYERRLHREPVGTVRRVETGWQLLCAGGVISLGPRKRLPFAKAAADPDARVRDGDAIDARCV